VLRRVLLPLRLLDSYEERVRDAQEIVYSGVAGVTVNANKTQTDGFELNAQIDLNANGTELGHGDIYGYG